MSVKLIGALRRLESRERWNTLNLLRGSTMTSDNLLYLVALAGAPVLLALSWWGWFRDRDTRSLKWRSSVFLSGVCAGTLNFVVWWAWVVWLHFHYSSTSWKPRDIVSSVGIFLLFYTIGAAAAGTGKYRVLLGMSGILALLPWLPVGIV